jgi:putative pyruvate formate lyase activating enzyme
MSWSKKLSNDLPNYVHLYESGGLEKRVEKALADLTNCRICPWECGVNRLKNEKKVCRVGRYARVSSYFAHFGREVSPQRLADMMLELQERGCHNINWVTPEHVVPQILEALPYAIRGGLRLPIVYNTSAFDSLESLRLMDGIVDIYMPDFKYWRQDKSKRYLKTPEYPATARAAFKEMHMQVGDLVIDHNGLAKRGLLVRHLVMPGELEETREIVRFLSGEISPDTYVNIMGQYHPSGKVTAERYREINRPVTRSEMKEAFQLAWEAGLHRFDERRAFL